MFCPLCSNIIQLVRSQNARRCRLPSPNSHSATPGSFSEFIVDRYRLVKTVPIHNDAAPASTARITGFAVRRRRAPVLAADILSAKCTFCSVWSGPGWLSCTVAPRPAGGNCTPSARARHAKAKCTFVRAAGPSRTARAHEGRHRGQIAGSGSRGRVRLARKGPVAPDAAIGTVLSPLWLVLSPRAPTAIWLLTPASHMNPGSRVAPSPSRVGHARALACPLAVARGGRAAG